MNSCSLIYNYMITKQTPLLTDSRLPIYQQLKDLFIKKIQHGDWDESRAIPAEHDLASEYGVAPGTVRKAIETLVLAGYLTRKQGSGTFIRRANFGNALFRFFRHTDEKGRVLEPSSQILSVKCSEASVKLAERLGLNVARKEDARIIRLKRLRQVNDDPILYEEIMVCARRFKALLQADPSTFGDLLYPMYDTLCNVRVQRATETISFGRASSEVAKHLRISKEDPVAVIERQAYDLNDQPVEWRVSYGLASRFTYSVELK